MKEFASDTAPEVVAPAKGMVCAGLFHDNAWHRVRLNGRTAEEGRQRVIFMDYGNTDVLDIKNLRQLPEDLAQIPACSHQATLAGLKVSKGNDAAENALRNLQSLVWDRPVTAKIEAKLKGKLYVTLSNEQGQSINQHLLENGILRVNKKGVEKFGPKALLSMMDELLEFQKVAIDGHLNIWEHGNVSSGDEDEESANGRRRPNGRQQRAR